MGFLKNIFKPRDKFPEKKELEVPQPPPTSEELPSPEEISSIKEAVIKPRPAPKEGIIKQFPSLVEKMEKRAVEKQKEILEEREELTITKPIFIPIKSFKDIVEEVSLISNIVKESEDTLTRTIEFKEDENKEYNRWQSAFKDIQKQLIFVDKSLFGIKG